MSKTLTEAEIQENLDRHYPLIEHGAEPPGRYETVVGEYGRLTSRRWVGKRNWSTAHGDAVVRWSLGHPVSVKNVALANGERVNAQGGLGDPSPWRYPLSREPRRWLHGTVDIRPDGAIFTPGEQPKYTPPAASEFPNLEFDLAHDNTLRERLIDSDFADALYAYLKNGDFWKSGGDRIWSIGLSGAAGLIAGLRGHGDVYTDYYPHGGNIGDHGDAVFAGISELLKELEWRRATAEDKVEAAVFTRRDLERWEQRPTNPTPEWVGKFKPPAKAPVGAIRLISKHPARMSEEERARDQEIIDQTLEKRLYQLAVSGRISEFEYLSVIGRIRQIP